MRKALLFLSLFILLSLTMAEELESNFQRFQKLTRLQTEAQQAETAQKFKKAAKVYKKLSKLTETPSEKANYQVKAGDCFLEANKTQAASLLYREVMQNYPLYTPYEHVIEQLRKIAERYVAGEGTFLGLPDKTTAISIYFLIIQESPAIHVSQNDRARLAELLILCDRSEEAVNVYQDMLKLDASLDDVRLSLAQLLLDLSKNSDGDGSKIRAALRHARIILQRNPNYARKDEVTQILTDGEEIRADRLLSIAKFYLRKSHYRPEAAKASLQDLLNAFPTSHAALEAKDLLTTHPAFQKTSE